MTSVEPVARQQEQPPATQQPGGGESFHPPSPEVFRPARQRWLNPAAFGFSRLALQLLAVSLTSLVLLLAATLWVADLRRGAVDAVVRSLTVQSNAVAAAFARSRSSESGLLLLSRLGQGSRASAADGTTGNAAESAADVSGTATNSVAPAPAPAPDARVDRAELEGLLGRILEGSPARVRTFDPGGRRITDSAIALEGPNTRAGQVLDGTAGAGFLDSLWHRVSNTLFLKAFPPEPDDLGPTVTLPEVTAALSGVKDVAARITPDGDVLISVATPIRDAGGEIVGALHLRSGPGAVGDMALAQELAIVRVFLAAAIVAAFLSLLLAASVTRPLRRLASAAERIRRGGASTPMPELRDAGEIGELSRVLHDMTVALYQRIDAIEAFAGEVAHELKNPLTSLRSAVETLPLARNDSARQRLMDVIQHDVRRIDRLISDISEASKLDAELNRHQYERFDLVRLLRTVVAAQAEIAADRSQSVELVVRGNPEPGAYQVHGSDSRLSQVFINLIDNARSFTPEGGRVVITVQRFSSFIEVVVDDEGPGIAEEALERIFERFYTDRSEQRSFGNNSGLGLAISRQIVDAHNGEIFAENRHRTTLEPGRDVAGARFTVRLPTS